SIALTDAGGTAAEVLLHSPDGFGHILFDQIERLVARAGVNLHEIECFAAAAGPGSFTGVRVGLTAVKGLAEAVGKRVVAVSNLQALAHFGSAPLRATVLDARRGEVYGAVYDAGLEIVSPEVVMKFPAWLETIPKTNIEFVSTDFGPFAPYMDSGVPVVTAPRGLAAAVGNIAWQRWKAGLARDPIEIDANYVRRSDAELFWKDAREAATGPEPSKRSN
ncbi:MAG: tRNA (adenosine(37)-N6)-threonylcarbamoyltransferase complex dimerization subunit type 1 TsaB, partial [Acidobacteriaceae bacterium]|nr:tRNA (adenosine(37)-N6)-threonylcarbamoyltransferase complex dimerization subunit type 1 TsaB [Acidobacteriaceae bacterium]